MRNPFPALITYMLIQTVSLYPLSTLLAFGLLVFIGWGIALNELFNLEQSDDLSEAMALQQS
ncbi:hypothetical protein [Fibrella forsythiae]|uniref:Uncharacterized protein n=1 Tax=Fibrella forsythiae TaxID=2817061 RepID=A0ABS3JHI3_9BACT|nr:hypothetical protein [Fibrella forsythiae]MBO0948871.1 hypothetical protein [Fibrella forsythiae]